MKYIFNEKVIFDLKIRSPDLLGHPVRTAAGPCCDAMIVWRAIKIA